MTRRTPYLSLILLALLASSAGAQLARFGTRGAVAVYEPAEPDEGFTCADTHTLAASSGVNCPSGVTTGTLASHIDGAEDDGKRIYADAGSYGAQTFARNHQEVIFASGSSFGIITVTGDNVRLACATARGCTATRFDLNGAQHTTIDGIAFDDATGGDGAENFARIGTGPFALLNSDVRMDDWCLYSNFASHITVGNSRLRNSGDHGGCIRFQSVPNTVIAGNWLEGEGGTSHNYRNHADAGEGDSGNNWFVANLTHLTGQTVKADGDNNGLVDVLGWQYFNGNCLYYTGGFNYIDFGSGTSRPTDGQVRDNVAYGDGMIWPTSADFSSSSDIANNTSQSYTTPPAMTYDGTPCT
jgi:hypothetical protein